MLKAALCGNYVNFAVFRLYGDEALDNVLNTFVKLLLSINLNDLLVSTTISRHSFEPLRNVYPGQSHLIISFSGLSKTVANILRSPGVPRPGSYELFIDTRTKCLLVYFVFYFRGPHCFRWEHQFVYRYFPQKTELFVTLYGCREKNVHLHETYFRIPLSIISELNVLKITSITNLLLPCSNQIFS